MPFVVENWTDWTELSVVMSQSVQLITTSFSSEAIQEQFSYSVARYTVMEEHKSITV
jgi:hypothetical protein